MDIFESLGVQFHFTTNHYYHNISLHPYEYHDKGNKLLHQSLPQQLTDACPQSTAPSCQQILLLINNICRYNQIIRHMLNKSKNYYTAQAPITTPDALLICRCDNANAESYLFSLNCAIYSSLYSPCCDSSISWVPSWTILPLSSTMILSAC